MQRSDRHIFNFLLLSPFVTKYNILRYSYLQSNLDLLGEGSLGEDRLHLGNYGGTQHAGLGTDCLGLLTNPRYDGEVVREVRRQDACDALVVQLFGTFQICRVRKKTQR